MKKMNLNEMKSANAGWYKVYCPVCGYKSTTDFFKALLFGKRRAVADAEVQLSAKHWRFSKGYIAGKNAHK